MKAVDFVEAKRRLRRTIHLLGKYPGLRKRARRYRWRLYTLRLLEGKLLGPISERGDPIQVLEEVKRGGRFREMFRLPVDAFEATWSADVVAPSCTTTETESTEPAMTDTCTTNIDDVSD